MVQGRRNTKLDEDIEEIIRLYVKEKWTINEIAHKYNCAHSTIGRRLKSKGVKIDKSRKSLPPQRREVKFNNKKEQAHYICTVLAEPYYLH